LDSHLERLVVGQQRRPPDSGIASLGRFPAPPMTRRGRRVYVRANGAMGGNAQDGLLENSCKIVVSRGAARS
jgi:hypothetical protein